VKTLQSAKAAPLCGGRTQEKRRRWPRPNTPTARTATVTAQGVQRLEDNTPPLQLHPTTSAVGVTRHGAGEAAAQRPPAHCLRAPAPRAKETGKVTERIGEKPGETKLAGLWVLKVV
jgi:hypothetical protein